MTSSCGSYGPPKVKNSVLFARFDILASLARRCLACCREVAAPSDSAARSTALSAVENGPQREARLPLKF